MMRIVYVAGKYRHYNLDGSYDIGKMLAEVAAEHRWTRIVAECGVMWFGPLSNSVHLESDPPIDGDEFVRRDLAVIRRLRPGYDVMLMRAGWNEQRVSVGASMELAEAEECGLLVAHTAPGEVAVRAYLLGLDGKN